MSSENNIYAYYADYSAMAGCLAAIRHQEESGVFNGDAVLLQMLHFLQTKDILNLYNRCKLLIDLIDGNVPGTSTFLKGDFDVLDFSSYDFSVGIGTAQGNNPDYSAMFAVTLQLFAYFSSHPGLLSEDDKQGIDSTLIPVLDAFDELQAYLEDKGLNPCDSLDAANNNNSPGLYLQTTGSDGTGGIAAGIHLRWSLAGELGENHFPRGSYSNSQSSPSGYNRPDDYVYIDRTLYTSIARVRLDFETAKPVINHFLRQWTYVLNHTINGMLVSDRVRLTFSDTAQYNRIAALNIPLTNTYDFLNQYNGLLRIEVIHKKAFAVGIGFNKNDTSKSAHLKLNALCVTDMVNTESTQINIRRTIVLDSEAAVDELIYGENIYEIDLMKDANGLLKSFSYETYDDFVNSKNASDWTNVGSGFALSLDDQTVLDRLESAVYPIDNLWPQYTGGSKVRIANYHDKWLNGHDGEPSVKEAVARYLALSETDSQAMDSIPSDDGDERIPDLQLSYLDILHILSLDYHIARMLGLGFIDTVGLNDSARYIYRVRYTSRKGPDAAATQELQYLSMPTGKSDLRIPQQPGMRPLTYTMPAADQLGNSMVNEQGYAKFDDSRVVNIGRELFPDERDDYDFFADLTSIDNANPFTNPRPALYGIEYRPDNESNYIKPEITNEKAMGYPYYAWNANYPGNQVIETVPVPDNSSSLYIHFERQTGVHHYAIYGIDLLGRGSEVSLAQSTDATSFPSRNKLVPPADFSVQYIQPEDTLLFTTPTEQRWLDGRTDQFEDKDVCFTRLNFNWLDVVNVSYLQDTSNLQEAIAAKPDKVKAFFRTGAPLEVIGRIINIVPVKDNESQVRLYTAFNELVDGSRVEPFIAANDAEKFIGSLLSTAAGQFQVVSITGTGVSPVITIEMASTLDTVEDDQQPGLYAANRLYTRPAINSRFSMVENLTGKANWSAINETISLVNPGNPNTPVIETYADGEGNLTTLMVGGIHGQAVIEPVTSADQEEGVPILPGYYKISYSAGSTLAPHPQVNLPFDPGAPGANTPDTLQPPHVSWYNGLVRVPMAGNSSGEKKLLQVIHIEQADPLVLYAYDASYTDPARSVVMSASNNDPVQGVNFHPGYRAYLFPEPGTEDDIFNASSLAPAPGEDSRKVMFALQATNSRPGYNFESAVSVPTLMLVQKIAEPEQLNAPLLLTTKVRPDMTGKAALTLDVRVEPDDSNVNVRRNPFGFMFYRTNEEEALYALYEPGTVELIKAAIAAIADDQDYNQRYSELVNVVLDNEGHFREHSGYRFPDPDKTLLTSANDSPGEKYGKYLAAVRGTLLPLTEQPPINAFLKTGYQTENKEPTIRDINGKLLTSSSPGFDPFPMARVYPDKTSPEYYVRFTDYSLEASSRKLHFYAAAEITNQLVPGRLSYLAGPVIVLNTAPFEAPVLRTFAISTLPTVEGGLLSVVFSLSPSAASDEVSKVRIFRTTDIEKSAYPSLMDSFTDVQLTTDKFNGPAVVDTFTDLPAVPLGETIYYRLAAVRTIINEKEHTEDIISEASPVIVVRVLDIVNPQAPEITYIQNSNQLNWPANTTRGTYYLYQQNKQGNWARIFTGQPGAGQTTVTYQLPAALQLTDENGQRIYYRYKVRVQNSAGLFNLAEQELTV
jgi:hypothetical protein